MGVSGKLRWNKDSVICLISQYKHHKARFGGPLRNLEVWQLIANEVNKDFGPFSAIQCENKFSYEKKRYIKKKENMGSKSSGAGSIRCQFFEEFDDIFKKQPNINPTSIASSSKGWNPRLDQIERDNLLQINSNENIEPISIEQKEIEKEGPPLVKKRKLNPLVSILMENQERRDVIEEKRDQQFQTALVQQRVLEGERNSLFEKMMNKLIEKM